LSSARKAHPASFCLHGRLPSTHIFRTWRHLRKFILFHKRYRPSVTELFRRIRAQPPIAAQNFYDYAGSLSKVLINFSFTHKCRQ
jgi:hypothetical protein